jgi:mono/diheme cytochrome c family protein|uniref:C-type cytochrome n=1 Tax=Desulfobacca acetoxidans TaxID=60893 RepID=A0A7V6A2B5_9BACT
MTVFNPFYNILYNLGFPDPIHPPLTHMPIGLVVATLIFGFMAFRRRDPVLTRLTRSCLVLAWLFFFPTVLFGFMDWQHWYQGAWVQPIIIKMCLAAFLFLLLSLGLMLFVTGREQSKALLIIYVLAFFTVMGLGYFGGRLVFGGRAPAVPPRLEAGRRLFANHCMACHPSGGNAILPGDYIIGSGNLKDLPAFLAWIRNPRLDNGRKGPMPGFSPQDITDEQAGELYAYLARVMGCGSQQRH